MTTVCAAVCRRCRCRQAIGSARTFRALAPAPTSRPGPERAGAAAESDAQRGAEQADGPGVTEVVGIRRPIPTKYPVKRVGDQ